MNIYFLKKQKNKKKIILISVLIFSLFFSFINYSQAVFNKEINYQGKLTTSSGVAVANGTYNIEFKIYTASNTNIWTETRTGANKVQITNGLFSVMLGEVQSLTGVDFNQTLYLGVNIGGTGTPAWDGEMSPRKKLGTVPSALVSETVLNGVYTNTSNIFTQTNPLITPAESWIGPSSSGGVYFKGGNVGIGTTNPTYGLDINGSLRVAADAYFDKATFIKDDNSVNGVDSWWGWYAWEKEFQFNKRTSGNVFTQNVWTANWDTGNLNLVPTSGNVGVGMSTAPGTKLDVAGGAIRTDNQLISTIATGTAPLSVASTTAVTNLNADLLDGQHGAYYATAAGYVPYTGGTSNVDLGIHNLTVDTNSLFVDSVNHRIGIGTTNPLGKLDIVTAASDNIIYLNDYSTTTGHTNAVFFQKSHSNINETLTQTLNNDSMGALYFRGVNSASGLGYASRIDSTQIGAAGATYIPADLNFSTSDGVTGLTSRLYIQPAGNVGIGTTNPGKKLEVLGDTGVEGNIYLKYTGGNYTSWLKNNSDYLEARGYNGLIFSNNAAPYGAMGVYGTGVAIGSLYAQYGTSPTNGLMVEGSVGIGLQNPSYKLDILGDIHAVNSTDNSVIVQTTGVNNAAIFRAISGDGTTSGRYAYGLFQSDETSPQRWDFGMRGTKDFVISDVTASGDRLKINTSGRTFLPLSAVSGGGLTIGGTYTGQALVVYGGSYNVGGGHYLDDSYGMYWGDSSTFILGDAANKYIRFNSGGAYRMSIDGNTGNVGIGTIAPARIFDVIGNGGFSVSDTTAIVDINRTLKGTLDLINPDNTDTNFSTINFNDGTTNTSGIIGSNTDRVTGQGKLSLWVRDSAGTANTVFYISNKTAYIPGSLSLSAGTVSTTFAGFYGTLDTTAAGAVAGINNQITLAPTINSASSFRSYQMALYITGAVDYSGILSAMRTEARMFGTGNITGSVQGIEIKGIVQGSSVASFGTIAESIGATVQGFNSFSNTNTGTVTNTRGVLIYNASKNSQTLTNQVGLNIEEITTATNNTALLIGTQTITSGNYAIYNASALQNYFGGRLGLGSVVPSFDLSFGNSANRKIAIENAVNTATVGRSLTVAAGNVLNSGTSNLAGGQLILSAGLGKGTGDSSIAFQTGTTLSSGSTLQTLSTKMTILGNGNVGIGTTNPGYLLDVNGRSRIQNDLVIGSATPTTWTTYNGAFDGGTNAIVYGASGDLHLISNAKGLGTWTRYGSGPSVNQYMYNGEWHLRTAVTGAADSAITWSDRLTVLNNGNVGIGTTGPVAPLHVSTSATAAASGNVAWDTNGGQLLLDTTASNAANVGTALTFRTNNNVNNGTIGVAAIKGAIETGTTNTGYLSFLTRNASVYATERMRIDSQGNVGIGTTSPISKLNVSKGVSLTTWDGAAGGGVYDLFVGSYDGLDFVNSSNREFRFQQQFLDGSISTALIHNGHSTGTTGATLQYVQGYYNRFSAQIFDATGNINFFVNPGAAGNGANTNITPQNALAIAYTGNIGVGTANPNTKLQISGANSTNPSDSLFSIQKNEEGYGLFGGVYSSGTSFFQSGLKDNTAAYNLALQPNGGNVGIGTTNPKSSLHIGGSTTSQISLGTVDYGGNGGRALAGIQAFETAGSGGGLYFQTNPWNNSSGTGVYTPQTRMTINEYGNVGIGTITPSFKMDVNGYGRFGTDALGLDFGDVNLRFTGGNPLIYTSGYAVPIKIEASIISMGTASGANVGIGTNSPSSLLTLNGSVGAKDMFETVIGGTSLFKIDSVGNILFGRPSGGSWGTQYPVIFGNETMYAMSSHPFFLINPNSSNTGNLIEVRNGASPRFLVDASGNVALGAYDIGNGAAGPVVTLGRNTNATNTGAGSINFLKKDGTAGYVWQDAAGNMRINTGAPTNANDTAGTVIGAQTSMRAYKQDITDYTEYDSALALVVNAPLHTFKYKNEVEGYGVDSPLAKIRIGFISDEVDHAFMVGNTIDQVSVNGLLMASVKQLNLKIQTLENKQIVENTPSSFGDYASLFFNDAIEKVDNGIAYMKGMVTGSLKVGSREKRTGITLFDEVTGDPYCLSIANGVQKTVAGECAIVTIDSISANAGSSQDGTNTEGQTGTTSSTDTVAPVITLNGQSTIVLDIGSQYSEEFAEAEDDIDGSVAVVVSGLVDTTKAGIYTISYNAMDTAGNKAIEVVRTINVGDVSNIQNENQAVPVTTTTQTEPASVTETPIPENNTLTPIIENLIEAESNETL